MGSNESKVDLTMYESKSLLITYCVQCWVCPVEHRLINNDFSLNLPE
jgi:hypothetical protein